MSIILAVILIILYLAVGSFIAGWRIHKDYTDDSYDSTAIKYVFISLSWLLDVLLSIVLSPVYLGMYLRQKYIKHKNKKEGEK